MPRQSTKTKKEETSQPVELPTPQPVKTLEPVVLEETKTKKPRKEVTVESLMSDFDATLKVVGDELTLAKGLSGDDKKDRVKNLKTIEKSLKTLRTDVGKVSKTKQKTKRQHNNTSGFMKPVKISAEMAKFTGWNRNELCSRVDVTKNICKYVKDNNLQNPDDKRRIVLDQRLSKLLGLDPAKQKDVTYCDLQKLIQPHFEKVTVQ